MSSKDKNKLVTGVRCCIVNCRKSKRNDSLLKMFKFPTFDTPMGQIWREKCHIAEEDYTKKIHICANHFSSSDIGKKYLKSGAVPVFQIPEYEEDFDYPNMPRFGKRTENEMCCSNCEKMTKVLDVYKNRYQFLFVKYCNLKNKKKNPKKKQSIKEVKESIDALNQINLQSKTFCKLLLSSRPKKYGQDVKDLVQNIYYVSQSTYQFLRNKLNLNLPHISTVNRWAPVKCLQPGFKNTGFEHLKKKIAELKERERKNMLLLVDEMAVRSELRYNSQLDLIDGFEDNGVDRTSIIAKYVCVFMIRSILSNSGIILNYFVSKNGLSASELKQILFENIRILTSFGITIKIITCDQGSSNRKCFTDLGVTPEKPFFSYNSHKVYCMFDWPNLMKSLRNGFIKCDLETIDGVVSFKVIQELWEIDSNSTTKMCPKLSRPHIYPNTFEKMKVKLATQVFSHTVQAAIKTVADTVGFKKCSKEQALSTASFIAKVDKIFDCLNSATLYSPNPYKSAIQINSKPYQYIKYFVTYLEDMEFVDKKKTVFFLDGMKLSLNAVLLLVEELFQDKDVFFLMTRTLNQDKLENTFSIFRQKGGNNNNPSIAEINRILARMMGAKMVQLSSSSNCEELTDCIFEEESIINDDEQQTINNEENEVSSEDYGIMDNILYDCVDSLEDDFENCDQMKSEMVSLRYFLGYVAFKMLPKINCQKCSWEFRKSDEIMTAPSELFIFHKNYSSFKDFGNLVAPSQLFVDASRIHVNIFKTVFENEPHKKGLKTFMINKCKGATAEWFLSCADHKEAVLDFLILVLIRKHCAWASSENSQPKRRKLKIITA